MSATAEELSAQANRLQDLMAFFRLADDQSAPAARTERAGAAPGNTPALRFGQGQGQRKPARQAAASFDTVDEASFGAF